jgi:hypothetical protein
MCGKSAATGSTGGDDAAKTNIVGAAVIAESVEKSRRRSGNGG